MDKLYTDAFVKEHDAEGFIAIASTEVQDRAGESIEVAGWDLKNFKSNPVLLAFHDHTQPIGKVTKIWVEKSNKPKLMFKAWISDATETARGIKRLMGDGVLRAFSVGFKPYDQDGTKFTKQELLEISVVSVPANQEALRLAYKSLKEEGLSDDTMQKLGVPSGLIEEVDSLKKEISEVKEIAETAVKGLSYLNPQPGRSRQRAHLLKTIAKAADKELTIKKDGPSARRLKVIKRVTDELIRDNKGDL